MTCSAQCVGKVFDTPCACCSFCLPVSQSSRGSAQCSPHTFFGSQAISVTLTHNWRQWPSASPLFQLGKLKNICRARGKTKTKWGRGAVMSFVSHCTARERPVSPSSLSQGQSSPSSSAEADWAPGSAGRVLSKVTVGTALKRQWMAAGRTWAQGRQCWHPQAWLRVWLGLQPGKGKGAGVGWSSCESAVVRELLINSIPKHLLR